MNQNTSKDTDSQEIDLSIISRKASDFFSGISTLIFRILLFFKRNLMILAVLFIVGGVAGYFFDKLNKQYTHEIIVKPNFGSIDYLYSKAELLQSKVLEKDSVFLKAIGIKNPKLLVSVKIEPIIDVYSFVNEGNGTDGKTTLNFELIKLLSESADINKVIKEDVTSKNYPNHKIVFTTNGHISVKNTLEPIFKYFNNSSYFGKIQKVDRQNIKIKMVQNQEIIKQIDTLIHLFSSQAEGRQKTNNLVYYNENTQLNELMMLKNGLVTELGTQRSVLARTDEVIKSISQSLNIRTKTSILTSKKVLFPILLIGCFILFALIKDFYRKQIQKMDV